MWRCLQEYHTAVLQSLNVENVHRAHIFSLNIAVIPAAFMTQEYNRHYHLRLFKLRRDVSFMDIERKLIELAALILLICSTSSLCNGHSSSTYHPIKSWNYIPLSWTDCFEYVCVADSCTSHRCFQEGGGHIWHLVKSLNKKSSL